MGDAYEAMAATTPTDWQKRARKAEAENAALRTALRDEHDGYGFHPACLTCALLDDTPPTEGDTP